MGLLDQVFGVKSEVKIVMNSAEAFAAICLVAIASDGYLSESEKTEMKVRLSRMQLFKDIVNSSEKGLDQVQSYLVDRLKKYGPNEMIACAQKTLPPVLATTAFATAVDLVFADGTVSVEEKAFIDDLRKILAITDEMALKIVEVMTIKNQG